jgi:hypothetical protein
VFDFRYHVASLVAVFLALAVGIVIGVGLSGQGVAKESERELLNDRIAELRAQLDAARSRIEQQQAAEQFVESSYRAVMDQRLAGKRIVVVVVGRADGGVSTAVLRALTDADGTLLRLRALKVPFDEDSLTSKLNGEDPRDVGERLGRELVVGRSESSLWDELEPLLVEERNGASDEAGDAVVVARTADLQRGITARFLSGFYAGLSSSVPAVWIDTGTKDPAGFSVVQNVESALGRVTLAVLLETGEPGEYGPGAPQAVPPINPVTPPQGG